MYVSNQLFVIVITNNCKELSLLYCLSSCLRVIAANADVTLQLTEDRLKMEKLEIIWKLIDYRHQFSKVGLTV